VLVICCQQLVPMASIGWQQLVDRTVWCNKWGPAYLGTHCDGTQPTSSAVTQVTHLLQSMACRTSCPAAWQTAAKTAPVLRLRPTQPAAGGNTDTQQTSHLKQADRRQRRCQVHCTES
jgi:hypothetical protein